MPRSVPHFKVLVSVKNHERMASVYADNQLFAVWVRLGLEAVARFADRTGDKFVISISDLISLTGKKRLDSAQLVLHKLTTSCPLVIHYLPTTAQVWMPNFAETQGFGSRNGKERDPPSNATSNPNPKEKRRAQKRSPESVFPEDDSELRASLEAWWLKHPEFGPPKPLFALDVVRSWAGGKNPPVLRTTAGWLQTCQSAVRKPWDGVREVTALARASPSQQRADRTKQDAREILAESIQRRTDAR